MPFIRTSVSLPISEEQETELKRRLGEAIALIPGKSEQWLMTAFEDRCRLYFRGSNAEPAAFVDVRLYGREDAAAFSRLTTRVTEILGDVLGIAADHVYVCYTATAHWGWSGENF